MSITPKNWAMLSLVNQYFSKTRYCYFTKGHPFFIPDFTSNVHYEVELIIKINRLGKHIEEGFAHKYYQEIGLGIDFTARDVQEEIKAKAYLGKKPKVLTVQQLSAVALFLKKN